MLDTNVISELAKATAAPAVVAWADAQATSILYATSISEAEMLYGLRLMPDGRRRDELRRAVMTAFAVAFGGRVLPSDRAAAADYAEWASYRRRIGRPVGIADAQVAAIARARNAKAIATRHATDFAGCGVPLADPWLDP